MIKIQFLQVVLGLALLGGVAGAEEGKDVPLAWQAGKTARTRVAFVPGGKVVQSRGTEVGRVVQITYSDGTFCSATSLNADDVLTLSCGTQSRHYMFLEVAGAATLSWVGAGAVGEKN